MTGFITEVTPEQVKNARRLSREEAVDFVQKYESKVVASAKKYFRRYKKHGYLMVDSVVIIPESVEESEYQSNPMLWSKGVISYNYYVNGNRDYQVIGDSMIGPYYEGNLPENISSPWKPGKIYGDGAMVSKEFHGAMRVWDEQINQNANQRREAKSAEDIAFVEQHKSWVLEFARKRYTDDKQVGQVESVKIEVGADVNSQYPQGVIVFDFLINGSPELEVSGCAMVGPDYPGTLRTRKNGASLEGRISGNGSSLRPGDIVDYMVYEQWQRKHVFND